MKIKLTESQLKYIIESEKGNMIYCDKCDHKWKKSEGGDDPNTCHKCGHTNKKNKTVSDKDASYITCKNCDKKITQTTYKNKKSIPVCPTCGTYNK